MSIQLTGIHKAFGPKQILRGLDLDVEEGETVSLVGFSGAGKSVTLKHIAGLLLPDRGTVVVDGKEVPKLSRDDAVQDARWTWATSSSSPPCSTP